VFVHFQPRLHAFFLRRSEGILPLDDLLQEVWLRAFLNVASLESAGALWAWLTTIGSNLLRDELRRSRPDVRSIDTQSHELDGEIANYLVECSDDGVDDSLDKVAEIRRKLSDEEWEFVSLLCIDNLSHTEVATRLSLTSAMASRQRLRRIRERLSE
jgi:RNA polymerase sigma factor (sigma-70 family)